MSDLNTTLNQRIRYYGTRKGRTDEDRCDQWTRMREDKLRGLRRALLYSYQAATVELANKYYDPEAEEGTYESLKTVHFRALINHDKLKVAYEDKIISIPYEDICLDLPKPTPDDHDTTFNGYVKTGIKAGDTFVWKGGNGEFMEDTYWIVYLQYSEETAYFRAEIREAKDEVAILDGNGLPLKDDEGNEITYHGYTEGPNETTVLWNTKRGIHWNDLNYTKLLYITKDKTTLDLFERFDKIKLVNKYRIDENGQYVFDEEGKRIIEEWAPWEVQAVNTNYGDGMIRVALKESYNNEQAEAALEEKEVIAEEENEANTASEIKGENTVYLYNSYTYTVDEPINGASWSIDNTSVADITNQTNTSVTIFIKKRSVNNKKFTVKYGDAEFIVNIASFGTDMMS